MCIQAAPGSQLSVLQYFLSIAANAPPPLKSPPPPSSHSYLPSHSSVCLPPPPSISPISLSLPAYFLEPSPPACCCNQGGRGRGHLPALLFSLQIYEVHLLATPPYILDLNHANHFVKSHVLGTKPSISTILVKFPTVVAKLVQFFESSATLGTKPVKTLPEISIMSTEPLHYGEFAV